ncbi:Pkinase domain-containing protein/WD40 domain-containing protein/HEAT domain-containing protein [Cephalotus follicularis]|uniref:non-specific serine/threonine protein kinase n=1 Tax=Cephalotus follicularis TaxID=3775 RepID=A0A1Q3CVR0_CEPFO|nr:Pkinase domain-containing protein/WD40 domain-containing protein/HEAT domain-containing protein [Cephalotus follicularis]
MGNKIARTTQVSASEYYLHDLPSSYNLVLKEVLGRGRFFKSILCKHDEGLVLVKVYFKRGDSIDLRDYERRLSLIKDTFRAIDHPHVWPFQFWQETDKAAYLLRQYFFNNLHDRLSTRPFLSLVEKIWLAFQLLLAVQQCHEKGICHGDIKCENVLVTSWNWLYLADFASFKPTYIPYDDPSDFSFFFDTGGRRLCYLAPERFYEHGGEMQVAQDAPLKPSMDIFAVGCVIAELFLEGQPLFELSQLLAYRRGQYDPSQHLEKIPDSGIRKMILHMIQLEPDSRLSAESYLQNYAGVVFPYYFTPFLHNFYCCWNPLHPDMKVAMCQSVFHEILKQMMGSRSNEVTDAAGTNLNTMRVKQSQEMVVKQTIDLLRKRERIEKGSVLDRFKLLGDINTLLGDVNQSNHYSGVKPMLEDAPIPGTSPDLKHCGKQSPGELLQTISDAFRRNDHPFLKKITTNDLSSLMSEYDSQSDTFGMPFLPLPEDSMKCEGMVLIASLLCSCIRSVKLPHLRRGAILLLKSSSLYIDDEDRLQRVLPYVIAMLSDPAAIVRCAALETLCDILPLVREFPPSDAKIFPEYILPMLSMLPDDPEESVRICYASNIAKLSLTAYGFLFHSIRLSEAGVLDELSSPQKSLASSSETSGRQQRLKIDAQLVQLRKSITEVVQELVMGPKQTPNIRKALLQDIASLCYFFGQRQSNDFLLPILPAFLNDRDEELRAVFFGKIMFVCFFVGQRSVEEYLLPYIEQALSDATEAVIVNALDCLAILCKSGFLRKRILLEMIERAFPLLCYPSQWVKRSAVTFIAASSESLGAVDSYVFLAPVIRPFLRRQPSSLASEKALLSCLKPSVSRQVFYQFLENARSSDMLERQRKIWYNSSAQSKQWDTANLMKEEAGDLNSKECWPDKQQSSEVEKRAGNALQHTKPTECDVSEAKFRDMGSFIHNASSMVGLHDPLCSDKLQFSGIISPQACDVNSVICDKSSEGIPLYSFSMDKRAVGVPSATSDSPLQNSLGVASSSMPWMDPLNKSFSLASSVPAPKLVSGSFSISSGSKQFYRVVHEPDGRENDQTAYVNSKFQEMGLSGTMTGSSVTVEDSSTSSDIMGLSSFARTASIPDSGWRPRGVLVAHLQEHRSAVNDIAVSNDHSFFVSASDDSTVKVWDSRKLEKDISFRSRLTYHLEGSRALCTTMLRNSAQVVVGACDGMIHMFSVDYISRGLGNVVEKYSGVADIKKKDIKEGAILTLLNYTHDNSGSQMVMFSTQNCGIHLWDIRLNSNTWTLKATAMEGYVSSLVIGPCGNWFVSGSSRGVLTLWDLRFLIPVNSWQYSLVCPIESMCLFVPPSSASLSTSARPLVYVAAGCNEVGLWNAENGSCHQVLRVANYDSDAEMSDMPWALARPSSKTNSKPDLRRNVNPKYRADELNEPPPRLSGIRSLLPLPSGDLLTGGTDLKIRRWDHSSPDRSYCICGPNVKGVGNDYFYETRSRFGVQVVQETRRRPLTTKLTAKATLASAATDSAGCHRDSIFSLASVKLNQRLLLSSSRDGAIKVWK